jgi:hypothetical protein
MIGELPGRSARSQVAISPCDLREPLAPRNNPQAAESVPVTLFDLYAELARQRDYQPNPACLPIFKRKRPRLTLDQGS